MTPDFYQQIGEAHAVIPKLKHLLAGTDNFWIDDYIWFIEIEIKQPFHDAQLWGSYTPAEAILGPYILHGLMQIIYPLAYQGQFLFPDRLTDFI